MGEFVRTTLYPSCTSSPSAGHPPRGPASLPARRIGVGPSHNAVFIISR
jgi:hypothetical protein